MLEVWEHFCVFSLFKWVSVTRSLRKTNPLGLLITWQKCIWIRFCGGNRQSRKLHSINDTVGSKCVCGVKLIFVNVYCMPLKGQSRKGNFICEHCTHIYVTTQKHQLYSRVSIFERTVRKSLRNWSYYSNRLCHEWNRLG